MCHEGFGHQSDISITVRPATTAGAPGPKLHETTALRDTQGARPPSDRQIANEGGGQPGPAERLQPVPHAGEELGASGLPECVSARLRGQVGQVILSLVQNLKWIAQAGYLFKETVSLGREMPRADLSGRWRRTAFESDGPVVPLHICPETLGFSWPCPQASGHGHDAPGAQKLIGL